MREESKRSILLITASCAWVGSAAITVTAITINDTWTRPFSSITIMLVGIAITCTILWAQRTMRSTITAVFQEGLQAGLGAHSEQPSIIETDKNAIITRATNTTGLGWDVGELLGKPLDVLVPARFMHAHEAGFRRWREFGEYPFDGRTFDVNALASDGGERLTRLTITVAGDRWVGIWVPETPTPNGGTRLTAASRR